MQRFPRTEGRLLRARRNPLANDLSNCHPDNAALAHDRRRARDRARIRRSAGRANGIGNSPHIPHSLFESASTLTSVITLDHGQYGHGLLAQQRPVVTCAYLADHDVHLRIHRPLPGKERRNDESQNRRSHHDRRYHRRRRIYCSYAGRAAWLHSFRGVGHISFHFLTSAPKRSKRGGGIGPQLFNSCSYSC